MTYETALLWVVGPIMGLGLLGAFCLLVLYPMYQIVCYLFFDDRSKVVMSETDEKTLALGGLWWIATGVFLLAGLVWLVSKLFT